MSLKGILISIIETGLPLEVFKKVIFLPNIQKIMTVQLPFENLTGKLILWA